MSGRWLSGFLGEVEMNAVRVGLGEGMEGGCREVEKSGLRDEEGGGVSSCGFLL